MIRLSWRQFQAQAAVACGLLIAVLILFATTRSNVDHLYTVFAKANAACLDNANCPGVGIQLSKLEKLLELIGTALVVVPALVGAFWGAPLIAREFENGTHRLVWTQSVTRTRWLACKLAVVGLASVAATGVLSLLVTWWSSPIDRAHTNRFASGMFGERNVTPMGYAVFGFALGVLAGLLIRQDPASNGRHDCGLPGCSDDTHVSGTPKYFFPAPQDICARSRQHGLRHHERWATNVDGQPAGHSECVDLLDAPGRQRRTRVDSADSRCHLPRSATSRRWPCSGWIFHPRTGGSGRRCAERTAGLRHETRRHVPRSGQLPAFEPLLDIAMGRDRGLLRGRSRHRRVLLLVDSAPR